MPTPEVNCLAVALREQLVALASGSAPDRRWPFLVTLRAGADPLKVLAVQPDSVVPLIRLAAARMTARQVLALADHAAVELIEVDGVADAIARAAAGAPD